MSLVPPPVFEGFYFPFLPRFWSQPGSLMWIRADVVLSDPDSLDQLGVFPLTEEVSDEEAAL